MSSTAETYSLAAQIAAQIENFLAESPRAVAIEDGAVIFDFSTAHYAVSPEREKCVLQIWSEERNIVRRVVGSTIKEGSLRLQVQRFGQSKPSTLELCADADRRTPSARRVMRAQYQRTLERALLRQFPGWTLERMTLAADLQHSFGPAHVRGMLRRGQSNLAVVGVSSGETQATVDEIVVTAILWLERCRERMADRGFVEGVCICVPQGRAAVVRVRVANLNHAAAQWRVFEVDERSETAEELDATDVGNFETRLVRCPDTNSAKTRLAASIARVCELMPQAEVAVVSATEVSFRLNGLDFARARIAPLPGSFKVGEAIYFGPGAAEIALTDETDALFRDMVQRLLATRWRRNCNHPLYRTAAESWLESIVRRDVTIIDERLDAECVYAQVPAFAASDRAMIDLLGVTRQGRLAVIELKAGEDLHLPIQGLDYWARVRWHHRRGEFQKNGYFAGRELSPQDPLLILVSPCLHVHPATDTLLHYINPEIEWQIVALNETWRDGMRVVFRKGRSDQRERSGIR